LIYFWSNRPIPAPKLKPKRAAVILRHPVFLSNLMSANIY
jgi:hypothetical protein